MNPEFENSTLRMDLNADLGEGFGVYELTADEDLMDMVTSVNVACGFHAGDFRVMRRVAELAVSKGVAVGAHPGFPDLQGFGRREMAMSPTDIRDMVLYQIGALDAFVTSVGATLHHVKPHGALYNMANRDDTVAAAIAMAVRDSSKGLQLYALPDSKLFQAGVEQGLTVVPEGFADRLYLENGQLAPRTTPGAVIEDSNVVAENAVRMAVNRMAKAVNGTLVKAHVSTICVHGDGRNALRNAQAMKDALLAAGVTLLPTS